MSFIADQLIDYNIQPAQLILIVGKFICIFYVPNCIICKEMTFISSFSIFVPFFPCLIVWLESLVQYWIEIVILGIITDLRVKL